MTVYSNLRFFSRTLYSNLRVIFGHLYEYSGSLSFFEKAWILHRYSAFSIWPIRPFLHKQYGFHRMLKIVKSNMAINIATFDIKTLNFEFMVKKSTPQISNIAINSLKSISDMPVYSNLRDWISNLASLSLYSISDTLPIFEFRGVKIEFSEVLSLYSIS